MFRINTISLLLLAFPLIGCRGGNDAPPNIDGAVEALPTIQAKSGGELVLLPAGSFKRDDNSISIASFYIDKHPVTQELYEKVMDGYNPSKRKDPKCPVERTRWTDAVRFCNKCSVMDGLTPCYDLETWQCNFAADGYRLPTEAEWEYACRAGSTGTFCCGDDEAELTKYAWFKPESQGKTHPVGTRLPNRWGLFDMHGNVWQWCNDWYAEAYPAGQNDNPRGPDSGKMRVLRGGAWDSPPQKCSASYRFKEIPAFADACLGADSYGFRRARNKNSTSAAIAPLTGKLDAAALKGTIVFVSDRGGSLKIWSMHASGKNARQLTKSAGDDADPRFAPDGKRILYTTLVKGFPQIWLMNRDGADPKFVTHGSQGNWAPDGKSIIYINDNQTFIRDLATSKDRLVTPKAWERCTVPAFSPDGKRFAVASRHLGEMAIFILSLDGKENTQLKTEESCCTPQWSKDGKHIIFQTTKGHVHLVGADGKGDVQLTFGGDVQHDGRYSPDGRMLLFCRAPALTGPWQICVKRLDGDDDEFVQITREGSNQLPDWHADQ